MESPRWKPIEHFFAHEGDTPLNDAFDGRRTVHPSMGLEPVAERDWARAWQAMTAEARRGKSVAYLHIPFCERQCLFCGFFQNAWHAPFGAPYVDTLIEHLKRDRDRPYQGEGPIHAVYLGGGTPSLLAPCDLARLIEATREHLPLAPDCEITVECRIQDLTPDRTSALFAAGVNRLSIGVQSFDDEVRRRIGRSSGRDALIRRLDELMAADCAAIIIDLIYGLPGQSLALWEDDVNTAIGLGLDGVDLYALKLMPHTPLAIANRAGKLEPAPPESQGHYYARGAERMAEARWEPLSSSHWRNGTRERNLYNLLIKSGAQCLAFGAGAGGYLNGYSYRIQSDLAEYGEAVRHGKPLLGGVARHPAHASILHFVRGSLERGRLDYLALAERLALSTPDCLMRDLDRLLAQWERSGLLRRHGRWIELSLAGRFWQVTLTQHLLDWIDQLIRNLRIRAERYETSPQMFNS